MNLITKKTENQKATETFGEFLAKVIVASKLRNVLVLLEGELGSGKTTFTKGLTAGVGSKVISTSPTFIFLAIYEGGVLPLYHFDLYRINNPSELDELGFFEFLTKEGIIVVEWGERVEDFLEYDIKVNFQKTSQTSRTIKVGFNNPRFEESYEHTWF
jgi:tRNA threonylcarbamoyladenosine biosynthesis protein TsaE